ncbi:MULTISPECIES: hypothetical protein [Anaerotruncus]|jgi:hypothetical protein|uniref:Zf-HC2 domain-containing protein n=2 Tax=Anaerotruncus TaxID=244127 RepID=A0A498CQ09_9FIRM|nr:MULTISPECIES: hypothetical protein [Anaerotruncus]MBC3937489.1 hypothetical protein [Anaerotruncus massiliensis (ex Togo et al. 2019)]MCQ4894474.1 hypothetical protein [Anaerotruncus sp. DFI.9.16]RLL14607.1 hypothetical protein D4A47_01080 [Anaerotruncus massiliensis (ex Liu et al. 2021)]GKH46921.1 hypothetical protein CE91St45_14830 [Oscillospiraceae bacterium]
MKELFDPNGHLTDDAFGALLRDEPLDEMERLEISEHLSFCDRCVERYAALLDGSELLSPPEPVAPPVFRRIRERARKLFVNKYATAAAAACFAIMFWNIGLFNVDVQNDHGKILDALANGAATFSERTTQFTDNLSETLDKILQSLKIERGSQHEKE